MGSRVLPTWAGSGTDPATYLSAILGGFVTSGTDSIDLGRFSAGPVAVNAGLCDGRVYLARLPAVPTSTALSDACLIDCWDNVTFVSRGDRRARSELEWDADREYVRRNWTYGVLRGLLLLLARQYFVLFVAVVDVHR